ncbi:MAG TPA: FAD-binding oxidoreductase [Chloroflexota bacterium]|nr:FAD-binding oxidoreductase [Chloroflexota bacterium]
MIQEADAVIVGAGAFGTSLAYHLARLGRRPVLVDSHDLASQTSPRAAGLTAQIRGTELMAHLAMRSVGQIERFTAETGEPLTVHQPGSLKIARTPEHEAQLRAEVARGRGLGLEIDLISPAEAHRLSPFVEPAGIRAVTYVPRDLYIEPGQLPLGYARAAGRLGATLLAHTPVTGILVEGTTVQGVCTPHGEIRAPVVVDAAGAWARLVGELAGRRIPVVPTRHQLLITEPIAGVRPDLPIVRIVDANVYVRPDNGGLMLGGYEADPLQWDSARLSSGFQIGDLPLDLEVLRSLAGLVLEQLPVFRELRPREHRGGLPTMTADGLPIVGPVPGLRGFFVASGCCVGGLTISPAVGEVLAEWIVAGEPPLDLSLLAPGRFSPQFESDSQLAAAARQRYARHYSVS